MRYNIASAVVLALALTAAAAPVPVDEPSNDQDIWARDVAEILEAREPHHHHLSLKGVGKVAGFVGKTVVGFIKRDEHGQLVVVHVARGENAPRYNFDISHQRRDILEPRVLRFGKKAGAPAAGGHQAGGHQSGHAGGHQDAHHAAGHPAGHPADHAAAHGGAHQPYHPGAYPGAAPAGPSKMERVSQGIELASNVAGLASSFTGGGGGGGSSPGR